MRGPSPGSTSGSEVAKNRMPRIVASTRSGYTLTVMAPCAPRAAESTDGVVSQATNSASSHTLPDAPAVPGVRPRITSDSPPGGRRFPTLTFSRSASVTRVSPTQRPTAAFRSKGMDRSGALYHSARRRWSSRSKRKLPAARSVRGLGKRQRAAEAAPVRRTNVRRSIVSMLVAWGALSTTLGAQSRGNRAHAIGFGFVATVGDNWQVETAEIGYVHRPRRGLAAISLAARVGTFINESMMVGGMRGFVTGATLSGRTRMKSIAQLGQDEHGTGIGLDVTLEVTGYHASHSP